MKRFTASILLCVLLTACATTYTRLEPQRVKVSDLYTVESQTVWSRATSHRVEVWTVDGPLLEAIQFFDGLDEGDTLFDSRGKIELPNYDKDMQTLEIQEFVVDSMIASGNPSVEPYNLRPWEFGQLPGFRFDMKYKDQDGLEHEGFVVGTVHKDKLYLIMYTGTHLYYYPKHRGAAESVIASIRVNT